MRRVSQSEGLFRISQSQPELCRISPCQSRLDDHRILESRLMELEKMVEANREAVTRNREVSSDEISEDNE